MGEREGRGGKGRNEDGEVGMGGVGKVAWGEGEWSNKVIQPGHYNVSSPSFLDDSSSGPSTWDTTSTGKGTTCSWTLGGHRMSCRPA